MILRKQMFCWVITNIFYYKPTTCASQFSFNKSKSCPISPRFECLCISFKQHSLTKPRQILSIKKPVNLVCTNFNPPFSILQLNDSHFHFTSREIFIQRYVMYYSNLWQYLIVIFIKRTQKIIVCYANKNFISPVRFPIDVFRFEFGVKRMTSSMDQLVLSQSMQWCQPSIPNYIKDHELDNGH